MDFVKEIIQRLAMPMGIMAGALVTAYLITVLR
jgi:hypothetical protein